MKKQNKRSESNMLTAEELLSKYLSRGNMEYLNTLKQKEVKFNEEKEEESIRFVLEPCVD